MRPALIVVGLGNPGNSYANTRHNIGFLAVDVLAGALSASAWTERGKMQCETAEAFLDEQPVLLVIPQTFMNNSGDCIRKLLTFYKLPTHALLVICDDIDLPLGTFRLRLQGGPGTHNGLKSIVDAVGELFPRLRIGLGTPPKDIDLSAWVLSRITEAEHASFAPIFAELESVIAQRLATIMLIDKNTED
jgi:PTH1 family peptidyl-tRNA hydrolase